MKIDGREIAETLYEDLRKRVAKLQKNGILPHLAVLLVGDDPSSKAYVLQKQIKGKHINAEVSVMTFDKDVTEKTLVEKIKKFNIDPMTHGIIVQRPLPSQINNETIDNITDPKKDVDGFLPTSRRFKPPVALAVIKIIEEVYSSSDWKESRSLGDNSSRHGSNNKEFLEWLSQQNIVVLGQGKTGGGPTIRYLQELGYNVTVIRSKTEHKEELTKKADIIISAVGKANAVTPQMLKKDVILISIGMHKGDDGKLHGDYDEESISNIASFYTPSPGGVGPVNVAMLLSNLIAAAENS